MRLAGWVAAAALVVGILPLGSLPVRADTAAAATMLSLMNDLREAAGAPRTVADARVEAAARAHADYLSLNSTLGHFEEAGRPGYTGYAARDRLAAQGYQATWVSEVATSHNAAQSAVLELWHAPYHRLGMMHPHNVVAGWGHSSLNARESTVGNFVYNFSSPAPDFVRSPAHGQTGVPTSWSGNESPSPLPAGAARPVGYPIMVIYRNAKRLEMRGAELRRAFDNTLVPIYYVPQQFEYDYQVIIPQQPLLAGTTYHVRMDLTAAGAWLTNEWQFTTSADGAARLTATLHAQWLDQSASPTLVPGQTVTLQVRYKNSGSETWQKGVPGKEVRLGVRFDDTKFAQLGMAVNWPFPTRPAIQQEASVAPGGIGTFVFTVQGTAQGSGSHFLSLQPVIEGVKWLEDYGLYFLVTVDHGYHSRWVSQSPWPTMRAGEVSAPYTLVFKNAGGKTWVKRVLGQEARLAVNLDARAWDALMVDWLMTARPAAQGEAIVAPGTNGTFTFRFKAPATPGLHSLHLRLVIDGTTWMEDEGVFLIVSVVP